MAGMLKLSKQATDLGVHDDGASSLNVKLIIIQSEISFLLLRKL